MRMFSGGWISVGCVLLSFACTDALEAPPTNDASTADAAIDASHMDASHMDASPVDASDTDAGVSMDATVVDAAIIDAATDATVRPDPALFDAADILAKAQCGVDLDEGSDGTIDQRWDYEFDANNRVVRMVHRALSWGMTATTVRLYDSASRLRARAGAYCSSYRYETIAVPLDAGVDDPRSSTRVVALTIAQDDYACDTGVARSTTTYFYDRRSTLMEVATEDSGGRNSQGAHFDGAGRELGAYYRSRDYSEVSRRSYHPHGMLKDYVFDGDPEQQEFACNERGWLLYRREYDTRCHVGSHTYDLDFDSLGRPIGGVLTTDGPLDPVETLPVQFDWDTDAGTVDVTVGDGIDRVSERHYVGDINDVRKPAVAVESYDYSGNVSTIERDADADGRRERVDRYVYRGGASCRDGSNRHLLTGEPVVGTRASLPCLEPVKLFCSY